MYSALCVARTSAGLRSCRYDSQLIFFWLLPLLDIFYGLTLLQVKILVNLLVLHRKTFSIHPNTPPVSKNHFEVNSELDFTFLRTFQILKYAKIFF